MSDRISNVGFKNDWEIGRGGDRVIGRRGASSGTKKKNAKNAKNAKRKK
jgi:hypothetical protein